MEVYCINVMYNIFFIKPSATMESQMEMPNRIVDQTLNIKNKLIINEMVAKFRNLSPDEIDGYLAQ